MPRVIGGFYTFNMARVGQLADEWRRRVTRRLAVKTQYSRASLYSRRNGLLGPASRATKQRKSEAAQILRLCRVLDHISHKVFNQVVLQMPIPAQIRQLIFLISNSKQQVYDRVGELTF